MHFQKDFYSLGLSALEESKLQKANYYFSQAIKQNPDNADAYRFRGFIKNSLFDYVGAISDLTKGISLNPENYNAYTIRAYSYFQIKNLNKALCDFNEAILLEPFKAELFRDRGITKDFLYDYEGALADFTTAIELEPKDYFNYLQRGSFKRDIEDFEGALYDIDKAIELNPVSSKCYALKAGVFEDLKKHELAVLEASKAIELDPVNATAYSVRLTSNFNLSNFENAIGDCRKSLEIDDGNPLIFLTAANLFYKWKKEIDKAICCLRIANDIDFDEYQYLFQLGNYYAEWEAKTNLTEEFFQMLGKHSELCKKNYVDSRSFAERKPIAQGFYSQAFIHFMHNFEVDFGGKQGYLSLYLFVGDADYMLDPLLKETLFFSDVRSFTDLTDCPLLNEINQSKLAIQTSYQNVRIRCLCHLEGDADIEKCRSMWDRYANGHYGVCYKLRIPTKWLRANSIYVNKVTYVESEMVINCDSPQQVIDDGLFKKDIGYADEKEWRMVQFGEFEDRQGLEVSFKGEDGSNIIIESIYFGSNVEKKSFETAYAIAKERDILTYKMSISERGKLKSQLITELND